MDRARILDLLAKGLATEGHGTETAAALAEASLQQFLRTIGATLPAANPCRTCGASALTEREVGRV